MADLLPGQLNSRWLHYFHEALKAGSIRGASDRLDIEPSVISRQIRQLEQTLGVTLMERHGRGIRATEAGALLLDFYREQHLAEQVLFDGLAELDGLQRGHISLSISEGYSNTLVSKVLSDFSAKHPALQISMSTPSVNDVVRQVFEGQAHIGIAYSPRLMPGIDAVASVQQPVRLIVRAGHPLSRKRHPLSLDDILAWPLGLIDHGFGLRQLVDTVEVMEKRSFHATLVSASLATLKQYVQHGDGITFMAEVAASQEIARGQLLALSIDHPVFNMAQAHVLVRSARPLSSAAAQLLQHILEMAPFNASP